MKTLYSLVAAYTLLASGCVGPQCLQDCPERRAQLERETNACYRLLDKDLQANSREHRSFGRHFQNAIEATLGARPIVREEFYSLDPDHFEDGRDAILELYATARKKHPWIAESKVIEYELTEERPPYRRYTLEESPNTLTRRLADTRAPRRKTTLGEIADALHDLFGWIFSERPR